MPSASTPDAPTSFHTTSVRQLVSCRVCGRTLLLGERSIGYFTLGGEGPFDVCQLCTPRAQRFGLIPHPSTAEDVLRSRRGGLHRRLVATLDGVLRGRRVATEPARVQGSAAMAADASAQPAGRRARKRRGAPSLLDPVALGSVPVGAAAIPMAVAAFNQSPHARTLAGLQRTLGVPRASVVPRSATDREVIVTVAWEIVWYQFRVMPDAIEQHSGHYLSELAARWQHWNCDVTSGGTLQPLDAPDVQACQDDERTTAEEVPR